MARITKAQAARNARIAAVVDTIGSQLGLQYKHALDAFAAKHGNDWPTKLLDAWYSGQDAYFRDGNGEQVGHLLRQVRNHPDHGCAFYDAYNG